MQIVLPRRPFRMWSTAGVWRKSVIKSFDSSNHSSFTLTKFSSMPPAASAALWSSTAARQAAKGHLHRRMCLVKLCMHSKRKIALGKRAVSTAAAACDIGRLIGSDGICFASVTAQLLEASSPDTSFVIVFFPADTFQVEPKPNCFLEM